MDNALVRHVESLLSRAIKEEQEYTTQMERCRRNTDTAYGAQLALKDILSYIKEHADGKSEFRIERGVSFPDLANAIEKSTGGTVELAGNRTSQGSPMQTVED